MKNILLATTMLVATAGVAAAEVKVSGDARMGVVGYDGEVAFNSRARVSFGLSGESDGGLAFGGSFRADNAGNASSGTAGSVFISGAFGKLEMGDVDGAAQAATGNVAGVGFTGLGDLNESAFIGAGGVFDGFTGTTDPTALYSYTSGAVTGYASVTNPGNNEDAMALGVKYTTDAFTLGLGYESLDYYLGPVTHIVVKGSTTVGGVNLQALYGQLKANSETNSQYAVSASYAVDAVNMTAFYADDSAIGPFGAEGYGLGATYDLGGGASLAGGIAHEKASDTTAYDLGVNFSF